jgi:hypothetical protein
MTLASAQYSHAEGNNTIAAANYQHVQGQWNVTSSIPAAFIVGNGTDDGNRSNLIYAHDSIVEITGSLEVNGGITGSLFGTASYVSGSIFTSTNPALSASYALTASYAANAGSTFNSTSSIIGNGVATSFNINHGFNTRNLHITVYEDTTGNIVYPDLKHINANTSSIIFANPPSSSQYVVYISQ